MKYIVKDYLDCERCNLHKFRRNLVFGRGSIPADVLFIGEAPGQSEDLRGEPFIGLSGRLLEEAIQKASKGNPPRYFITNVVACLPCDDGDRKIRPPQQWEALKCSNRLLRTIRDVKAKRVILLGQIAKQYCLKLIPGATCLVHPAYILRIGGQNSTVFHGFVRDIAEVFNDIKAPKI